MEEKEKVDPGLYKKEFNYLDELKGKFDFSIFKNPVLAEANFFTLIAWYIDVLKNASDVDWEKTINQFIDGASIIDDVFDRFLFICKYICTIEIEWFSTHNYDNKYRFQLNLLNDIYEGADKTYQKFKRGEWHVLSLPGIAIDLVPKWYWTWFDKSELEKKVMVANSRNFLRDIREVHNRNNYMTDE